MITDQQIKGIIGDLLHDIGKIVYRSGDGRNHSQSGYEYLKETAGIRDQVILNCVKYHHSAALRNASLAKDDRAYITYYADNVASFADRREAENPEYGFDKSVPLESVFNILNENSGKSHYAMQVLNLENEINYPTEQRVVMDEHFYQTMIQNITDNLKGIQINEEYINSLLSVLEANTSYIPSSTSRKELADISLYDHVKITAAIASCVEQYLDAQQETDYRQRLFAHAIQSYEEKMFLLYSIDISGIQSFIYTISESGAGALKGLRARSFYLEILMEHMADELLERLSLSRANLIYTGGGHCSMLLPNTERVRNQLRDYEKELNNWMMETFGIALYTACGYAEASANNLRNVPEGSYRELYRTVSRMISNKKAHRYEADTIRRLNSQTHSGERECLVCRRTDHLIGDKCTVCAALEKMSGEILHNTFFTVLYGMEEGALPLPGNRCLVSDTEKSLRSRMELPTYVRCYTKNRMFTGKHVTTKLWVGDYTTGETFEELADNSEGVRRIAVLRADVDNLGSTFVNGFRRPNGEDSYTTISRTAVLSRQLSLFFKGYINKILKNGSTGILSSRSARSAVIVYSGGDDVFLAGSWNDVIAAFIDLHQAFERFTQGSLTISGGVGIYHSTSPLNIMAKETELLEEQAKDGEKNSITLFDTGYCYSWPRFLQKIVGEKLEVLNKYFRNTDEHGMAFLYHLLDLLRNSTEKINTARYIYLLSRMEPEEKSDKEKLTAYRSFSKKMYEWQRDAADRQELITTIYLYVYLHRKKEENDEADRR